MHTVDSSVLGQFGSKRAKINSKSSPVDGVAQCVWRSCAVWKRGGGGPWLEAKSQGWFQLNSWSPRGQFSVLIARRSRPSFPATGPPDPGTDF